MGKRPFGVGGHQDRSSEDEGGPSSEAAGGRNHHVLEEALVLQGRTWRELQGNRAYQAWEVEPCAFAESAASFVMRAADDGVPCAGLEPHKLAYWQSCGRSFQ